MRRMVKLKKSKFNAMISVILSRDTDVVDVDNDKLLWFARSEDDAVFKQNN